MQLLQEDVVQGEVGSVRMGRGSLLGVAAFVGVGREVLGLKLCEKPVKKTTRQHVLVEFSQ